MLGDSKGALLDEDFAMREWDLKGAFFPKGDRLDFTTKGGFTAYQCSSQAFSKHLSYDLRG